MNMKLWASALLISVLGSMSGALAVERGDPEDPVQVVPTAPTSDVPDKADGHAIGPKPFLPPTTPDSPDEDAHPYVLNTPETLPMTVSAPGQFLSMASDPRKNQYPDEFPVTDPLRYNSSKENPATPALGRKFRNPRSSLSNSSDDDSTGE